MASILPTGGTIASDTETARGPPSSGDCLDFRRHREHGWNEIEFDSQNRLPRCRMSFDETPLHPEQETHETAQAASAPVVHALAAIAGSAKSIALNDLPVGVTAILGAPDALTPTVLRLLEMGFTPGTPLAITRRAPGGDPVEVRVRGTRLCVRRADLARFSSTLK
jgi:ferrous iron transport protein A